MWRGRIKVVNRLTKRGRKRSNEKEKEKQRGRMVSATGKRRRQVKN